MTTAKEAKPSEASRRRDHPAAPSPLPQGHAYKDCPSTIFEEKFHELGIQRFSCHILHDLSRLFFGVGAAVGPLGEKGMPDIGRGDGSGAQRDFFAF